jgi:hypothetical protein
MSTQHERFYFPSALGNEPNGDLITFLVRQQTARALGQRTDAAMPWLS